MLRFRIPLFALAFLVVMATAMPTSGGAQEATPAARPRPPQPPSQPTTGPGSSEALFGGMTTIEQKPPGQFHADYWLFVPSDPLPGTAQAGEPFPVVIFLHGSGATDADPYLAWIEHLVRRGAVVLYPLYQRPTAEGIGVPADHPGRRARGLETLEREGVPVDLTRVAVVGHSLGAEQALIYAASAAAADLPVPTAVMSVAPGCCPSTEGRLLGVDLGAIPATTRLLLVTEADDPAGTVGVARIWAELGGVPLENRDVVTLVPDKHGQPRLFAVHVQALADHGSATRRMPSTGTAPGSGSMP